MKTKVAFLTILAVAAGSCVWAQSTEEYDDMYFTSKDRATLNASRHIALSSDNARRITESETTSAINPTDSYSARNVNPEYISGAKVNGNTNTTAQYFSPNYQPIAVNQNLASNCNSCYTNYNNSYYSASRFGSPYGYNNYGYSGMNPYGYNSMMSPYGYGGFGGYGSSFYQSGLSFGFGSGYGWGSSSMSFGNSYYGMNSFYNSGYGYGGYGSYYNPYAYNPYRYGGYGSSTIVVVDRPRPHSARNQEVNSYYSADGTRASSLNSTGGRIASNNNSTQYYNRTWRNDTQVTRGSDTWNNTRSYQQQNYNNSWNNQNNNDWGGRSSFGGFNNGGSRSSFSTGGGGGHAGGGGSRRGRD